MSKRYVMAAAIIGFVFAAATAQAAEPLELQQVMKDLGKHMQTVTDSISREDWDTVAKIAPQIAEHPQPPLTEKLRIMKFMGAGMSRFKAFDGKTHAAAEELAQSAREKNGQKVVDSFHKLQSACLGCHQEFRAPFVAHFYGNTNH